MDRRKPTDDLLMHASLLQADHQTLHISAQTQRVIADADLLRRIASVRAAAPIDKAQGFLFEQLEVTKFNLDALKKGSNLHAATTDSLGLTNHPEIDVVIRKGRQDIASFQLKSGNKASASAFMLSDKKYADVSLVGPSDQYDKVNELYDARIAKGALKSDDYKSASQRLHRGVSADGVSSGGTRYDEALQATNEAHASDVAAVFKTKAMLAEAHESGKQAGAIGAGLTGGLSAVSGLVKLARGEAETGEIVAQVAIDAAKGYVTSYATTAMSKGISHGMQAGLGKVATNALTKSNAHLALAAGIFNCGKSLVSYLNGDIDDQQLLSEVSHTAIAGAGAFYYGALGQAVIPIPVVGALIGSTVGYFVGNMLHQSGLLSLGEAPAVKIARERRERVEALCMTAIPLMRAHRLELDALMKAHFAQRSDLLTGALDDLEAALVDWNANDFLGGLQRVNSAFGALLPFQTQEDFDTLMLDEDKVFVL